ncbi:cell cycle checkpoint protein RAD1 [Cylas formicarius]|uniref:cell cycle checkpoint protein RAD1 n=1 Tax=Cylas formicarius TaxID=197179 RepID=UPI00295842B9|nr:cell cycle checkpoint protein RAD1 [Cylas formicarius]
MLFCAELTTVKVIYNVLKSITIKDFAIVRPMKEGLKITVEEMKCIETSAYIPCNMFSMYHIDKNEECLFKINLKTLTEILNIFGDDGNSSLKLSYKSPGSPLCLVLYHGEENITVGCEIRTMNCDDFENPSLAEECDLNKIVINANILLELLQRLDNSAEEVKITFNPQPPNFILKTSSLSGESEVNISKHSESVTLFQCKEKIESVYAFSNIRHILKVMHYASKVAISTGESGLLGLQLVINSDDNQMYVEYYVTALYINDQ